MLKNKLLAIAAAFSLAGLLFTACDENLPAIHTAGVESIELNAELRDGISLEEGKSTNISLKVSLTPADATDRAEFYTSSDLRVATVGANGTLTACSPGTSVITITVGGVSDSFTLTVTEKVIIQATALELRRHTLELMVGNSYELASQVKLTPEEANDDLTYQSTAPGTVSVNSTGQLKALAAGTAKIIVASKITPTLKDELEVTVVEFTGGDYPRTDWVMSASHALPTDAGAGNSITAALDDDSGTNFCLVRQGKTHGGVSVGGTETIWFMVDMQISQVVNYFRLIHRGATTDKQTRWYGFDEISGSNNGTDFTTIGTMVAVTNADDDSESSETVLTNTAAYRYIKFTATTVSFCYVSGNAGLTAQIKELYMGLN